MIDILKNAGGNSRNTEFLYTICRAGVAGAAADLLTYPITTLTVRAQLYSERKYKFSSEHFSLNPRFTKPHVSMKKMAYIIYVHEGIRGFFLGYYTSLMRQVVSTGVRLGIYDYMKGRVREKGDFSVYNKILTASMTAVMASLLTLPSTIIKIRFQSRPKDIARYRNVAHAYQKIYREEGLVGFWKGAFFSIPRLALINLTEVMCFEYMVNYCRRENITDPFQVYSMSATMTALFATILTTPFDVLQTRYMSQTKGQYVDYWDCVKTLHRYEGCSGFYRGYQLTFSRLLLWNLILWSILRGGICNAIFNKLSSKPASSSSPGLSTASTGAPQYSQVPYTKPNSPTTATPSAVGLEIDTTTDSKAKTAVRTKV